MSLVLAFDCAIAGLHVAVARDGVCLARHREAGRDQAATLLPAVVTALHEAGVARDTLAMIAVTVGPGSFTGVRVGLAAARGLAAGLGVPLAGVATTRLLLAQAPSTERFVIAAIDSRLGDWFVAAQDDPHRPFVATSDDVAGRLAGRPGLIVGPQAGALASRLADAEAHEVDCDPMVLAALAEAEGAETWRARNRADGPPRPLYLRGVNITLPDGARRTVE